MWAFCFNKKECCKGWYTCPCNKKHTLRPAQRSPLHAACRRHQPAYTNTNCTKYMFCAVYEKNKTDEPKMESTSTNRKKPECEIITLWLSDHCTLKPIKSVFLHDCRIIFIGIIQVRTTGYAVDRSGMAVLPHPICTRKSGLFGFCMRHPDIMLRLTGYRHIIGQK